MVWWGWVPWYHKLKIGFDTAGTGFDRVRFDKARRKAAVIPQHRPSVNTQIKGPL